MISSIGKINNKKLLININFCLNFNKLKYPYYIENIVHIIIINQKLWDLFKDHYGYDIEINKNKTNIEIYKNKIILKHRKMQIEFRDDKYNFYTELLIEKTLIENNKKIIIYNYLININKIIIY